MVYTSSSKLFDRRTLVYFMYYPSVTQDNNTIEHTAQWRHASSCIQHCEEKSNVSGYPDHNHASLCICYLTWRRAELADGGEVADQLVFNKAVTWNYVKGFNVIAGPSIMEEGERGRWLSAYSTHISTRT